MRGGRRHGDCANPDPRRRPVPIPLRAEISCHSDTFGIELPAVGATMTSVTGIRIGTSGWSYDHWGRYGHGHAVRNALDLRPELSG